MPPVGQADVVAALRVLDTSLDAPRRDAIQAGAWRWDVRRRLLRVRELLMAEQSGASEDWDDGRGPSAFKQHTALLVELARISDEVLDSQDPEAVRRRIKQLIRDIVVHLRLGSAE
jgi:hypothetical protein